MTTSPPRQRTPRPFRPLVCVPLLLAAVLLSSSPLAAQFSALRELEARLLEKRLEEYEAADQRARTAESEYRTIRQQLSSVLGDSNVSLDRLRDLETRTSLARETAYLRDREATELRREIYTLLERIQEMDRQAERFGPALTGTWTIDFGDDFGEGTVEFRTTGDRFQGSYTLESGATGLIRGELIGDVVTLIRYGPRGNEQLEARGMRSADGDTLSGNWITRELADGRPALGTWIARRQE